MYPVSEWILRLSKSLFEDYPERLERIWEKLIKALKTNSHIGKSLMIRQGKEPDWATEALNSPVGNLLKTLMNDPAISNLNIGCGFPSPWVERLEDLLPLKGDLRCYAIALSAYHLNLFYEIDPDWIENNLIPVLGQKGDDEIAFWAGFLWHTNLPGEKLFIRLKHYLLRVISFKAKNRQSEINTQILSSMLLAGWATIDPKTDNRLVTNDEMRKALFDSNEVFRLKSLWHLERRIANEKTKQGKKNHEQNLFLFLTEVWPKQKKVKSRKITEALIMIAFSNPDNFSKIVDHILPLVTEVGRSFHDFYMPDKEKSDIIKKFPKAMLKLMYEILSENASEWPYGVEEILEQIGIADPALLKNSRMVELKRRLNTV